jgi:hypothetical protein
MKRALPLVLLVIFLFNQVGYYGVHWLTLQHHRSEILRKLDNNEVDGFRTVTLKIPLAVPYPAATPEYERIKGAFEHHGERYKLVQQKLENDTLYIVCIRDVNEERLQHAMNDFVKLSHDNTTDSKTFKLLNSFCKDFHHTYQPGLQHASGWSLALTHLYTSSALRSGRRTICVPPPRRPVIV